MLAWLELEIPSKPLNSLAIRSLQKQSRAVRFWNPYHNGVVFTGVFGLLDGILKFRRVRDDSFLVSRQGYPCSFWNTGQQLGYIFNCEHRVPPFCAPPRMPRRDTQLRHTSVTTMSNLTPTREYSEQCTYPRYYALWWRLSATKQHNLSRTS